MRDQKVQQTNNQKVLKEILFFPRKVAKRYKTMIFGYKKVMVSWPEAETKMRAYITTYSRAVDVLIYLPFIIGLIVSSIAIYNTQKNIKEANLKRWWKYEVKLKNEGYKKIPKYLDRARMRIVASGGYPVASVLGVVIGYSLSFVGALALSTNPIFKDNDKIKEALSRFKYLDSAGNPWFFVYTPEIIFFYSYGKNPQAFRGHADFWATINFQPGSVVSTPDNIANFYIKRTASLPDYINFNFTELPSVAELLGQKEQKAAEEEEAMEAPETTEELKKAESPS